MKAQEIIEHQVMVVIRKVKKIPDGRYKSGYRSNEIIAVTQDHIFHFYQDPNNPNRKIAETNINLKHIDKRNGELYQSFANAEIKLALTESDRKL